MVLVSLFPTIKSQKMCRSPNMTYAPDKLDLIDSLQVLTEQAHALSLVLIANETTACIKTTTLNSALSLLSDLLEKIKDQALEL